MRRNLMRILAVMVAVGSLSLFSMPKDAEAVSLNLINTWRMTDLWSMDFYSGRVSPPTGGQNQGTAWAGGAFPEGGINIHFGIGFGKGDQIVPFLGLGMNRRSYNWDWNEDGFDDYSANAMQFGLEVGGKFFFIERSKGKAPPFVMISFYKYFGVINDEESYDAFDADDGYDWMLHDQSILSPQGIKFSFGAEYYFNDNFALGADFLGLNFSWASGANSRENAGDIIEGRNQFSLYTGLTLTYRFSFTVRASVQFEADYDYED